MENDFEPTLGHAFTFRMKPQRGWDGLTHCEGIELEPLERLAFSYRGRATGEKVIACAGVESQRVQATGAGLFAELDTVLRITLTPDPAVDGTKRTRLVLVLVSFVMGLGWSRSVLPRLPPVLDAMARCDAGR